MKCPFCYQPEPTWDHVQECGRQARKRQAEKDKKRRIREAERIQKARDRDKKNGTWNGWKA